MSAYTVEMTVEGRRLKPLVQPTSTMAQAARNGIAQAVAMIGHEPSAITMTVAQLPGEATWESAEGEDKLG